MCTELCVLCCARSCACCIRCWFNRCKWVNKLKKHLEFEHHRYQIYTSSFQRSLQIYWLYYVFRWVIFLLCLSSFIITYGEFGGKNATKKRPASFYLKYPIYLTYITLTLAVIQTLMALIILTRGIRKYGFTEELPSGGKLSCLQWCYWKLMALNTTMAMSITIVFWLAIFPRIPNAEADANNVLAHGCNAVYAVIDLIVNGLPYNFSDILYTMCYGVVYFIFTFIYWHAGGWPRPLPGEDEPSTKVIYPKCLNWYSIAHPVVCGLGIICHIFLSHIILCALMQAKSRWMPKFDEDSTADTSSTVSTSSATKTAQALSSKVTPGGDKV